jgi:hypothetical protein
VKAIVGTQKNRLETFGSLVKGINAEYVKDFNDSFGINPGVSVVSRTLTEEDRKIIDEEVVTYPTANYFKTTYNSTVLSLYNTLRYGKMSLYTEGAYMTPSAVTNPYLGIKYPYKNTSGYALYGSLTYAVPKLGVTVQGRIMENFQFRSSAKFSADFNLNNNRRLSFIAPINKQNSLRLPARFQIAPQEIGEMSFSIDITYSLSKHVLLNINGSIIDTIGFKDPYYREGMVDIEFKKLLGGKLDQHIGVQYIYNNQIRYQNEGVKDMTAITGFLESTYRLSRKKSLRMEFQYQHAPKDIGQSAFALLEFNIAPSWSFSVSDLFNFKPNQAYTIVPEYRSSHHFYSIFTSFTKGTNRFTLAYAKQLAGIVCTGGVCRFEPAFSGLRFQMTSTF